MFCKRLLTIMTFVFLAFFFVMITGCTSYADSYNETLSEISSLENAANGRLKTMDFSSPNQFTSVQAETSKDQYSNALAILTSGKIKGSASDSKYKNMVRSLELKYAFLDMYMRFEETEERISMILSKNYPEFQKELKETMIDLENFRYETKSLQIMAGDIDASQLDPANQEMIPVIEKDIGIVLLKIDMYISLLIPYQ